MLLACYSHKHISYRIRTIIRKAIVVFSRLPYFATLLNRYNLQPPPYPF
ncbi:hypothetical protein [Wolbachia endosymbiont (group A) of Ischnus inquisitorius]